MAKTFGRKVEILTHIQTSMTADRPRLLREADILRILMEKDLGEEEAVHNIGHELKHLKKVPRRKLCKIDFAIADVTKPGAKLPERRALSILYHEILPPKQRLAVATAPGDDMSRQDKMVAKKARRQIAKQKRKKAEQKRRAGR